jgi:hypothetical protein
MLTECVVCGTGLQANNERKMYCSGRCKVQAHRAKKKNLAGIQEPKPPTAMSPPFTENGNSVPFFYYNEKLELIRKQEQEIETLKGKLEEERYKNHEHEKNEIVLKNQVPEEKGGLGGIEKLIENPEALTAIAGIVQSVFNRPAQAANLSGIGWDEEIQIKAKGYGDYLASKSTEMQAFIHNVLNQAVLNEKLDPAVWHKLYDYLEAQNNSQNHARKAAH